MQQIGARLLGAARRTRWIRSLPILAAVVLATSTTGLPAAADDDYRQPGPGTTVRVSVSSNGEQANAGSERASVSADGRFAVFTSYATNLVRHDTNGIADVFVRDLRRHDTSRVSVNSHGEQANGGSAIDPQISPDGRYVVFTSDASNLVPGDTNGAVDVFRHDLRTGDTIRVSVGPHGAQGNGPSAKPTVSADGRYVAFTSYATNLVDGDTNGAWDTFVKDLATGKLVRASVGSDGTQANAMSDGPNISADGRYAVFISLASNLVPGDTNNQGDVFAHDLKTGTTTRISVGTAGEQGDDLSVGATLSGDGHLIGFASHATTMTANTPTTHDSHAYVREFGTGRTTLVDLSNGGDVAAGGSFWTAVSGDGRSVAFVSDGANIVPGDTNAARDIFVRDLAAGTTTRISLSSGGAQGDGPSFYPFTNRDAHVVAFQSYATNLVPGDTNGVPDVFVRYR